ncbi:MAG: excinuclease ABC subunit UvrC, partial [Pseudomonadota bacterium]
SHDIPEQDLLADALAVKAGRKVLINRPQRGEKRNVVEQVARNAKEALLRKLAESATQAKLMAGLQEVFDLPTLPRRVEVYDNSHIMGTNAVGGMVVAGPEGFAKNSYRKFNIKNEDLTPGDDYGMMREVFTRRFSRLVKEHGDQPPTANDAPEAESEADVLPPWPDLVLIDGGAGQLSAVQEVMKDLGLTGKVNLVGVAKGPDRDAGRERFFQPGKPSFSLPLRDPTLYFIQRLRDEAHRFAIGTHRARRKKETLKNPLDEIAGVGPSRKRAILHHFGSAKAVSRAAVEDLMAVDGVSERLAQTIFDHFQNG